MVFIACVCALVPRYGGQRTLTGLGPLLPPWESWGLNSGCWVCRETLLPAVPPHRYCNHLKDTPALKYAADKCNEIHVAAGCSPQSCKFSVKHMCARLSWKTRATLGFPMHFSSVRKLRVFMGEFATNPCNLHGSEECILSSVLSWVLDLTHFKDCFILKSSEIPTFKMWLWTILCMQVCTKHICKMLKTN